MSAHHAIHEFSSITVASIHEKLKSSKSMCYLLIVIASRVLLSWQL